MRPLRFILIYVIVVFVGGALLAPWLYKIAQAAATVSPGFQKIAAEPFHRFVNRALLGFALLGLWPFLKSSGVRSSRDVGLSPGPASWRSLAWGGAVGFGSLAGIALAAVLLGARRWNLEHSVGAILRLLLGAAATAGLVAVLEEMVFRGALFGTLRKAWSVPCALAGSSVFYALVHFFQRPEPPSVIDWASGLALLPRMMRGFGDAQLLFPGMLNLTVVGVCLALAYQRTGHLYFSIGLHAGWIFWLKSYGFMTSAVSGTNLWWWGSHKMIDGWLALVVLLTVWLGLVWRLPKWAPEPAA